MNLEGGENRIIYSICVSGAASGITVKEDAVLARQLGEAVAKSGQTLITGATIGLPYFAAMAASKAGGKSIGFSPAVSLREHLKKYRLPYNCYDFINFTGLNYVGRDLYLVQSSDAVITIGGRFGSLHEFTSALEAHKVCGVLTGSGGTADVISSLVEKLDEHVKERIIYSDNPADLVDKVIKKLDVKYKDLNHHLQNYDDWYLGEGDTKRTTG